MTLTTLYLPHLKKKERYLEACRKYRESRIEIAHWDKFRKLKNELEKNLPVEVRLTAGDIIALSAQEGINPAARACLNDCIQALIPWRTGPFNFFGFEIDSEWKSNLRWERLKKFLPEINNKIIADIGSGNGYFMLRMLEQNPKVIFGIDPQPRCVLQLELVNTFLKDKRLIIEPLGIENMDLFISYFDFVLCMGVIYHRRDPHTCLTKVRESMKPGATFIIETLVVEGEGDVSFSPPDRYMKMRNVWFVPSTGAMCSWLAKTGFENIKVLTQYDVGIDEQRSTLHSPDESLADFLDPKDSNLTIEGYKVPKRAIFSATA